MKVWIIKKINSTIRHRRSFQLESRVFSNFMFGMRGFTSGWAQTPKERSSVSLECILKRNTVVGFLRNWRVLRVGVPSAGRIARRRGPRPAVSLRGRCPTWACCPAWLPIETELKGNYLRFATYILSFKSIFSLLFVYRRRDTGNWLRHHWFAKSTTWQTTSIIIHTL